jgi:hypothetical protein
MLGRLRRANRHSVDPVVAPPPDQPRGTPLTVADYPGIGPLLDDGDMTGVMTVVDRVSPGLVDWERARVELQLRHEAFLRRTQRAAGPSTWPPRSDTRLAASVGVPDIAAAELTADALVAGVRNHGAVIVRGLFDPALCADLRERIDLALANFESRTGEHDPRWHTPFSDIDGTPLSPTYRANGYVSFQGQVPVADAPGASSVILDSFADTGVTELVTEYLGEPPVLTLEKWTLRRVPPTTNTSWHQDGAFLGEDVHTVNLWIALSDCGETASGLDVVGKRFDSIVATGTEGAYFEWDVAPTVVEAERGDSPIVSPVFEPGDAVFFDQFLLHRTGVKEGMTENRYALESWFFTPTSYPSHYAGLLA